MAIKLQKIPGVCNEYIELCNAQNAMIEAAAACESDKATIGDFEAMELAALELVKARFAFKRTSSAADEVRRLTTLERAELDAIKQAHGHCGTVWTSSREETAMAQACNPAYALGCLTTGRLVFRDQAEG